ncbi:3-polyprenyl-4-hydroxybenzoate decarboxylase [Desulforamulus putei DSM 12395]|uniref:3-polyprenyl-4-hydroxybenzoate decarboxylase n=1 Tax=Desulforamulus putei DSM 12395 TaxID=1121429 RepID=A0A1M5CBC7_9FIRM|nr:flavoprotein [Desulforamulus putei]SHF52063.1 3-polyprenyl-4-hydroxybenzoate decarboxylase [Desulforamulus putei DSM 12395]
MSIETLIKNLLLEILPRMNKKILIFLTGGTVHAEISLKVLADFEFTNYDLVISESGRKVLDQELVQKLQGRVLQSTEEVDDSLRSAGFVLVPVMTRNTLCKVALGIADNLVTTGIARAVMMNKEIIVVRDSYAPDNPVNISNGLSQNPVYNSMINNYEQILQAAGVKFVDFPEFKGVIQEKIGRLFLPTLSQTEQPTGEAPPYRRDVALTGTVLTLNDVKKIQPNKIVQIKENTIITPLARDYIDMNNIIVKFNK